MNDRFNLTSGNIIEQLLKVSFPVMLTSLFQMAYNLTDLFWLGRASKIATINDGYVASAGFCGLYIWLGAAIFLLVKIGTEVRVSQSVGRKDYEVARIYARSGVQLEFVFALIYSLCLYIFARNLIGWFNIKEIEVYNNSITYLKIISIGMIFYLINPIFSATLNGTGNTITPFKISAVGLVINMILDPLLIFVFNLDIKGAAIATTISQIIVSIIFLVYFFSNKTILKDANFLKFDMDKALDILKLGIYVAIQSALFTFISMIIAKMVTIYGKEANAVQKIGSQIEALSWLVAGGFQTALGAFVGQNFGARKINRVLEGVRYAMLMMVVYGICITFFMYFLAEFLFRLFLNNDITIHLGINYLHILAFSQIFMIIESLIGGAFNGLGKTWPPSLVSIFFNLLRIPMAYFFMESMGLNGIWLAITISSIFKGVFIYIWFKLYIRSSEDFRLSKMCLDDTI